MKRFYTGNREANPVDKCSIPSFFSLFCTVYNTVLPRYFLRFPIAGSAVANCGLPGPQTATVRPATAGRRKEPAFRIFPLNEQEIIYKAKGDYIQAKRKETREVFPKNSQGKEINRGYKITF